MEQRLTLLTQIIRLLLKMVPEQRSRVLRESSPGYQGDDTQSA